MRPFAAFVGVLIIGAGHYIPHLWIIIPAGWAYLILAGHHEPQQESSITLR